MAVKLGVGRGRGGEAAGGRCKGVSEGDTTVTLALVFRLARAIACKRDRNQMMHVTRHTPHATSHTSHVTRQTSHITRHTPQVTRHTSQVTRHTPHVKPTHAINISAVATSTMIAQPMAVQNDENCTCTGSDGLWRAAAAAAAATAAAAAAAAGAAGAAAAPAASLARQHRKSCLDQLEL
jgi:hypothetical protein